MIFDGAAGEESPHSPVLPHIFIRKQILGFFLVVIPGGNLLWHGACVLEFFQRGLKILISNGRN